MATNLIRRVVRKLTIVSSGFSSGSTAEATLDVGGIPDAPFEDVAFGVEFTHPGGGGGGPFTIYILTDFDATDMQNTPPGGRVLVDSIQFAATPPSGDYQSRMYALRAFSFNALPAQMRISVDNAVGATLSSVNLVYQAYSIEDA